MLLIFLCGGVLGALVMSYLHPVMHHPVGLEISSAEWKQKLDLTDDQTRRLNSVLNDFSLYYDNLLADGNTRIMQILNPDQRRKYDQMMREHRK